MRIARISALTVAAVAALGLAGMAPRMACASACAEPTVSIPQPAPISQIVEIDGRFVTVELMVNRSIGGAPIEGLMPTTIVSVQITVSDGGQLPEGLHAVGVRFEKLRGVNRFFFTPVSEVETGDPGPETDSQGYQGDLSSRASVQYLRAVVRLETDTDVIKVPMGIVHVNQVLLP